MAGAFRGEADDGVADGDGDVFGFFALAEGDAETADGEGVGDFFPDGDGDRVSWESATAVAAARPTSSLPSGRNVMARQTRRPVTTSPVVVPTMSRRLRRRCRAA
ncbi:hypothetical protein [Streptomyces canus]|uniref:hypothetical protein n=1 Tax=Streptomyces canus TaxID=58343 RepID=UPI003F6BC171